MIKLTYTQYYFNEVNQKCSIEVPEQMVFLKSGSTYYGIVEQQYWPEHTPNFGELVVIRLDNIIPHEGLIWCTPKAAISRFSLSKYIITKSEKCFYRIIGGFDDFTVLKVYYDVTSRDCGILLVNHLDYDEIFTNFVKVTTFNDDYNDLISYIIKNVEYDN